MVAARSSDRPAGGEVEPQLDVDLERLRRLALPAVHAVPRLEAHVRRARSDRSWGRSLLPGAADDRVAHPGRPDVRLARRGRGRCRRRRRCPARSSRASPRGAGPAAGRAPCRASTCATSRAGRAGRARAARRRPRSSSRFWSGVFPKPMPGVDDDRVARGRPRATARSTAAPQVGDDLGHDVVVAGSARLCITISGTPRAAASRASASSGPTPQMSLTASAPASSAASATAGLVVSMRERHVGQRRADGRDHRHDPAPARLPRVDLLVAGPRGLAADVEEVGALVDHPARPGRRPPPTGSAARPSSPSPENESGVTLRMPITNVRLAPARRSSGRSGRLDRPAGGRVGRGRSRSSGLVGGSRRSGSSTSRARTAPTR